MSKFSKWKVPLPGGRICCTHIKARLKCAEPCPFQPAVRATGAKLISPEFAEPVR